ncbi:hypothetical protein Q3G72_017190 [Acer saccharum]|nr:hypothetical protein Q3G72_017190 [Acer saccharum]
MLNLKWPAFQEAGMAVLSCIYSTLILPLWWEMAANASVDMRHLNLCSAFRKQLRYPTTLHSLQQIAFQTMQVVLLIDAITIAKTTSTIKERKALVLNL